jgi:hypothetical protein
LGIVFCLAGRSDARTYRLLAGLPRLIDWHGSLLQENSLE